MNNLINLIEELKTKPINDTIKLRASEFEELGRKDSNELFKELCFCLLTANFSAHHGIRIQNEIGNKFHALSQEQLAKEFSRLGHRFPNARAKYIFQARRHKDDIKEILENLSSDNHRRDWLFKNIKGLGMKESSHFLRNIGYKNVAIIDFHIIDLLVKEGLIERPKNKSLTPKKYLEIENLLQKLGEKTNTNLGELDLYLWYLETGKVLK